MNWRILNEPYPFNNELNRVIGSAFFFGGFVALFLIFFQPFGLGNYNSEYKNLVLFGYGMVTSLTLMINRFLFTFLLPKWFSKSTWTVGKNIFFTLFMFFSIGLFNLIYSNLLGFLNLDLDGFLFYQGVTVAVGVMPISISTVIIYNKRLKSALKSADSLNTSIHFKDQNSSTVIEFPSKNKKENVAVAIDELLAVTAIENYVELSIYSSKEEKQIIRNTLKNIKAHLSSYPFIVQCHRSHLVNLKKVTHFKGNAQGLSLQFDQFIDTEIPVSRKYVASIKAELEKN